jgi:N-acyl-D-amino-acid deacylase
MRNTIDASMLTRRRRLHSGRIATHGLPTLTLLVLSLYACLSLAQTPSDQQPPDRPPTRWDLVFRNARIIDGTGNPWFRGDVAVHDGRIAAVGRVPADSGRREIDVQGLVLAPGFIDIHSHSDFLLLEDGAALSKIWQGVTTEVLGEGNSTGPYQGKLTPRSVTIRGETVSWSTLGGYFDVLERSGSAVNVASYVGLDNLWRSVMGDSHERPTPEQLTAMSRLLEEAMHDGARGLSTMLAMPPGSLATTEELITLSRVVAQLGGIYSTHNRHEGTGVQDAVREAIKIGEMSGVRVDIIHLKIADQQYWGRMDELISLIDSARSRGVDVQANVYPYTRGNNDLASIIPPWAHEGGKERLLAHLRSPDSRIRLKRDIRSGIPGWYNHFTAVGGDWSRMLVSGKGPLQGLTMDRALSLRAGENTPRPDDLDMLFDILLENGGSVPTVYAHHTDADMERAMTQPWCSIGSDGSAYAVEGPLRRGNPHPRNFGTFPRVLGVYVRDKKLLTLEDAVRKMTSLNAAKINLRDRGQVREGFHADLVVFDPDRIIDRSTYESPFQYAEGIRHVVVNGQMVLDNGQITTARPGRALRLGR